MLIVLPRFLFPPPPLGGLKAQHRNNEHLTRVFARFDPQHSCPVLRSESVRKLHLDSVVAVLHFEGPGMRAKRLRPSDIDGRVLELLD